METQFITPIKVSGNLAESSRTGITTSENESGLFKSIFSETIQTVISAENNLANQQYLLATGQSDDGHSLQVAATEAQLAIDMLVQLRNKALESYNELMRIGI